MFCAGDLIRIPSQVTLYKTSQIQNFVPEYKVTQEPALALFIKHIDSKISMINKQGESWFVKTNYLRIYEDKHDKVSANCKTA